MLQQGKKNCLLLSTSNKNNRESTCPVSLTLGDVTFVQEALLVKMLKTNAHHSPQPYKRESPKSMVLLCVGPFLRATKQFLQSSYKDTERI